MKRKYTKKSQIEVENVAEIAPIETQNELENIIESPIENEKFEEEISIFIATVINLSKPKRILEIRNYSLSTTEKINNVKTGEMSFDMIEGDTLTFLKAMQGQKYDFIIFNCEEDIIKLIAEFKLIERLISKKGMVIIPNSHSSKAVSKLIQITSRYGYKCSTLETSGGNGISLIHRNI